MVQNIVALIIFAVFMGIPLWMHAVVQAAESLGFEKRVEYLKMGLVL